jgi:hypothetical protein
MGPQKPGLCRLRSRWPSHDEYNSTHKRDASLHKQLCTLLASLPHQISEARDESRVTDHARDGSQVVTKYIRCPYFQHKHNDQVV